MPSGRSHKGQMAQGGSEIQADITGGVKAEPLTISSRRGKDTSEGKFKKVAKVAAAVVTMGGSTAAMGALSKGIATAAKVKGQIDKYKNPGSMAVTAVKKRIGQEIGGAYARSSTKRALAAAPWNDDK